MARSGPSPPGEHLAFGHSKIRNGVPLPRGAWINPRRMREKRKPNSHPRPRATPGTPSVPSKQGINLGGKGR